MHTHLLPDPEGHEPNESVAPSSVLLTTMHKKLDHNWSVLVVGIPWARPIQESNMLVLNYSISSSNTNMTGTH